MPPRKAVTASANGKLFLFDEPTTGLHFEDVAKLLRAFAKLRAAGHSLLVIEHNLDVMRASDWIIDLGPEGGDGGGNIVFAGTPTALRAHPESHTGRAIVEYEQALATAFATPVRGRRRAAGPLGARHHRCEPTKSSFTTRASTTSRTSTCAFRATNSR